MAELESLQLSMEEDSHENIKEKWFQDRIQESAKTANFQDKEGACVFVIWINIVTLAFVKAGQTCHSCESRLTRMRQAFNDRLSLNLSSVYKMTETDGSFSSGEPRA